MWKTDADRMFEGIEPCAICYCVVHTSDRSVPKVGCKVCRHKFHAICLVRRGGLPHTRRGGRYRLTRRNPRVHWIARRRQYQWFNTSSQSTCPLCRNLF